MKNVEVIKVTKNSSRKFKDYIRGSFHSRYILCSERYFKWQYDGFYIIKFHGDIIGHFGYKELSYKVYGTIKPIRILMNLFVLEQYRIFGFGVLLAKKIFDTTHNVFTSGYTNKTKILGAHLRSSWKNAGNLKRYMVILDDSVPLIAKYIDSKKLQNRIVTQKLFTPTHTEGLTVGIEKPKYAELESLWRDVRDRYQVTVERGGTYLNWRFGKHPILKYIFLTAQKKNECRGYLVYRYEEYKGFKIAHIIDFIAERQIEEVLLSAFVRNARHDGAHAADFLFSGNLYHDALSYSGFFNTNETSFSRFPILFNPIDYDKTFINIAYDIDAPLSDCYFTKADGDRDRPNPH